MDNFPNRLKIWSNMEHRITRAYMSATLIKLFLRPQLKGGQA